MEGKRGGVAMAAVLALVAGSSYGVGGVVSQVVKAQGVEIGHIIVFQSIGALVILGVLYAARYHERIPAKQVLQLLVLGTTTVFQGIGYYLAIDIISVSAAVAMMFQYVWIAVVFQCVFERILPKKWTVIAAVMIIIGAVLASGLAEEIASGSLQMDPLGILYALLCAVFYALFIYLNGRIATDYHPVTRSLYLTAGGTAAAFAALPLMNAGPMPDLAVAVPWGALMGILMCILPTLCIIVASAKLPGSLVAILAASELPVAVLAGFIILGEGVSAPMVAGMAIIIAAIVLSEADGLLNRRPE